MDPLGFLVVQLGGLLFFGGLGVLIWLLVYSSILKRRRQIAGYHHWAGQHGFHYWPFEHSVLAISARPPLTNGSSRQAADVFRGEYRGAHLHFFELRYTTDNGNSQSTDYFQVVAISLPATRPLLDIRQESFMSKRFEKDIQFENQAFNDRFRIQSPSARFAYDVIHARMMEWMLSDWRAWSYAWRFEGPWLMTYRPGRLRLDEVFGYADFLHEARKRVPEHVWSD
ncbi:hypothetical protein [Glycomyces harbinensis]|uniref:DUF3137 domain-containing protein n=1 Tax=Glycomyces harbinensis TaxID=58114 RepID=A0A1G6TU68_9ACTN|nr:hypothetical protein [Glycomyces harbinensis]SDD32712.1 hypothetical protein SAMN05216270_103161 [Glycomyces harbinensis]